MVRGPESEMMGAVYKLRTGSVALAQQQVRFLISKTVGDYVFIILVFAKLLFLLVKPYIKAGIAFFKSIDVEVVYQDFGEDGSEQLIWFHFAKITLYS